MTRTISIAAAAKHVGETVIINGWAYNTRSSGKLAFIQMRDGSGMIQAVVSRAEVDDATWNAVQALAIESSVRLEGIVKKDDRSESGCELQATKMTVIHIAQEYPIGKKDHGPDFLLNNRHVWLRSKRQWAIQRIRGGLIKAIFDFLYQDGFIKFDSPILTPNACEGTTTLFEIDYFDEKAFLSQSGQLYLEAGAMALGKVFDFGPVFRAEKSKTRRHLMEFWMLDVEAAFVQHAQNLEHQERLITYCVQYVLDNCTQELHALERNTTVLESSARGGFPRITHAEAVKTLRELGSDIGEMDDLGGDDETILMQRYQTPIFIEKYPAQVKAFYMKRDPQDERYALCADMLAPEGYGEIIGGSEREDNYDTLLARIKEHNLDPATFNWYLDLRAYGSVPHAGYGLGLERLVAWVCGLTHVRETIPFPRMLNRLNP